MTSPTTPIRPGLLPTPPLPSDLPGIELTENARKVLLRRYVRRGDDGQPAESIDEMFWRVAYHVARVEEKWGGDVIATARAYYRLLTSKSFFPNSPTFTGAGTPLGQLAACFVLPISDDMGRRSTGIFQTLRDAALIQQTGGGNGFSFSRLRPKKSLVKSSAGEATGPVGFLRVYDHAFGEVAQGGSRRGANMAVLRVDHPDVEEFISCKTDENSITNFNISVGITDAFMEAVEADADWDLIFPDVQHPAYRNFDGTLEQARAAGIPLKVHKTVKARELFAKIVHQAHHNGEPGMLFLDAANRSNPVPHLYQLEATNPCGEQWLGSYENCCLGSVNLATCLGPDGTVDWDKLRGDVALSTRFLDDVVDANQYVPSVPALAEAAHRARRIGLGMMGLSDLMYHCNIRYGSPAGQEFAAQVIEFVRYHAMQTSVELAQARGAFPAFVGSIYELDGYPGSQDESSPTPPSAKGAMPIFAALASEVGRVPTAPGKQPTGTTLPREPKRWTPPTPLVPFTRDFGRPGIDWDAITDGIRLHGIRNAAQTTIAPTGTIATVAGCEGYGCEPVFALAYVRHVNDNGKDLSLTYASPLFERALAQAGIDPEQRKQIFDAVTESGSCQHVSSIPAAIREVFAVSGDISASEHVQMQAAMQAFVDNSLSKTVNFPPGATEEDVATAYLLAWKLGCKGITVYVTGSRDKVVLETKGTAEKKQAPAAETAAPAEAPAKAITTSEQPQIWHDLKKPRPRCLTGYTYSIETPLGKAFVTINENGGSQPFEVFVNTSKAGSETAAVSESLGRLVSYILRLASPVEPSLRLNEVYRQLAGIGGGRSLGFGPNRVRSLPDGLAQALEDYLSQRTTRMAAAPSAPVPEVVPAVPVSQPATQPLLKIGDLCPECGQAAVVNEEGCRKCYACGYSEC